MDTPRVFVCPTYCGCVVGYITTWPDEASPDAVDLKLALRRGVDVPLDTRPVDTPVAILSQCRDHAALDVAALWEEIRHFHGTRHRPDTCECALFYWWDDRESEDARTHHPFEHPAHTRRCTAHAQLGDADEHHAAVTAENQSKNYAVAAVATALGWAPAVLDEDDGTEVTPEQNPAFHPSRINWSIDEKRAVVIYHKAGPGADTIAAALESLKGVAASVSAVGRRIQIRDIQPAG